MTSTYDAVAAGRDPTALSERGRRRRTELIDATVRVIASHGLAGLSMRAVAAEAGIPLGALDYYFTDKADLVRQAFAVLTEAEIERVLATTEQLGAELAPTDLADLLADMIIGGLDRARGSVVAGYELMVEASRNAELATLFQAWYATMVPALRALFRARGSREPEADARLVLGVLAGLEIDHLALPLRPADKRAIRAVLRRLFVALEAVHVQTR